MKLVWESRHRPGFPTANPPIGSPSPVGDGSFFVASFFQYSVRLDELHPGIHPLL
jgi:hypothetical protein